MFAIHNQQCLHIRNKNDIYTYYIFSKNTDKMLFSVNKVVSNKITKSIMILFSKI